MDSEDASSTSTQRHSCIKWRLCSVISLVSIVVLICVPVVFFVSRTFSNSHQAEDTTPDGLASTQTGNMVLNSVRTDYRFKPNNSTCEEPSCTVCKAQVETSQHMPRTPITCDNDSRVINSSCYDCIGCKTLDYLRNRIGRGLRCGPGRPVEVDCCLLSQMGNDGQVCGAGGSYNCYDSENDSPPVCKCPFGRTGDRCQDVHKETLNCRCFAPSYPPFCGQEELIDCNSRDRGQNVTRCRMEAVRMGETFNCLCNKNIDGDDDVDDCTVPHTEPQTNDSRKLDYRVSLLMLMVISILKLDLVDKT